MAPEILKVLTIEAIDPDTFVILHDAGLLAVTEEPYLICPRRGQFLQLWNAVGEPLPGLIRQFIAAYTFPIGPITTVESGSALAPWRIEYPMMTTSSPLRLIPLLRNARCEALQ